MSRYEFKCTDVGLIDCNFTVSGKRAEDLIPQIAEHAKSAHNMESVDDEMKEKINNAIKKKLF